MDSIVGRIRKQTGFTLIEVIVVVAIIGTLAAITVLGSRFIDSYRLNAASRELYGDLQSLRLDALTKASNDDTRGFGIRFISQSEYKVFEFIDSGTAFQWDALAEEVERYSKSAPDGITITRGFSGDPTGTDNIRIFDKHGVVRTKDWGSMGISYVFHHARVSKARCVAVSSTRIREGLWNESATPPRCDGQ